MDTASDRTSPCGFSSAHVENGLADASIETVSNIAIALFFHFIIMSPSYRIVITESLVISNSLVIRINLFFVINSYFSLYFIIP